MKKFAFAILGTSFVFIGVTANASRAVPGAVQIAPLQATTAVLGRHSTSGAATREIHDRLSDTAVTDSLNAIIESYCVRCHGQRRQMGNLMLHEFDVGSAEENAEIAEKMIRKLRAGMMPPVGARRPPKDSLIALVEAVEGRIDEVAAANPNPGSRTFQRLNRAEYQQSIADLLDLEIDAGDYLPLDTKSANFDNIADVQMLSATLMNAYLGAADQISRLAVGDPNAVPTSVTYTNPGYVSQWERVDGAPRGTRGGISVVHNFPADAEYVFKMAFEHTTTGGFYGGTAKGERIEVSVNGERVALLEVDQWMHVSDPNGVNMETDPILVRAGPQRITAAFIKQFEGPMEDLVSPHDWSLVDRQIGVGGYGVTALAHLKDLVVSGPFDVKGVSDTPSRRKIFTCRPTSSDDARSCATDILSRLATQAYRRPLTAADLDGLMALHQEVAGEKGFETGIRTALQAILASPDFVFRFEEVPSGTSVGETYRVSDVALASRLSFFLWGAPPDDELLSLARIGELSKPAVLQQQASRMLGDARAEALGSRFAAQWLRLDDLDKVHPDRLLFPDFHQQLADAMRRETELFVYSLVRDNRDLFELLTADYTFVNEGLARHYGIPNVSGDEFRRVVLPDETRRGLLGHGSILTLTSHAQFTSPVLRGKWVMEVLLGSPPPPPPPNVPDLEATEGVEDGRLLSVRERLEQHRANPACSSCHRMMDPIGLALEYYDVTGRWRIKDNGNEIDAASEMFDGVPVASPADLREALLSYPESIMRNFIENLMAYALGRRIEHYDMPTVRAIARDASADGNRMQTIIMGVVRSAPFQMGAVPPTVAPEPDAQQ